MPHVLKCQAYLIHYGARSQRLIEMSLVNTGFHIGRLSLKYYEILRALTGGRLAI